MAYDKIIDSAKLDAAMTATANAIRGKTGKTAGIPWDESIGFASDIAGITPKVQSKTATPSTSAQIIKPDSDYEALSEVTVNAIPAAEQATPSISVSSTGLITASTTQEEGYVAGGVKSATEQLLTQAAKTVTPSTSDQIAVASDRYTTGAITVKGDTNLKAANIAKGVSIFGVSGSFEGGTKVATGVVTLGTNQRQYQLGVSGLGFKPTKICIFYDALNIITSPVQIGTFKEHIFSVYAEGDNCYFTYVNYPSGYGYMTVGDNQITLTLTENGFSISCNGVYFAGSTMGQYRYVAIG